jgi:hypothetical protein
MLSRAISQAELIEELTKSTSKWMKAQGVLTFSWQAGYGAFLIGESQTEALIHYIQNQEEHHREMSFQDEFRRLLERYRIAYEERSVWD